VRQFFQAEKKESINAGRIVPSHIGGRHDGASQDPLERGPIRGAVFASALAGTVPSMEGEKRSQPERGDERQEKKKETTTDTGSGKVG